ncbi:MAG: signal peptidase I, partial [Actinomycetota bacterium]
MTDAAPRWQATPRARLADTGELPVTGPGGRSWVRRHPVLVAGLALALALVVAVVVVRVFVLQVFFVPSSSMAPALEAADRIVVNRLDTNPRRGDIVVHDAPGDDALFVRRVIAFGGETVAIIDGVVRVDGVELAEPYLGPSAVNADFDPFVVPEGTLFLLGDNRQNAYDSRLTGPIDADAVI